MIYNVIFIILTVILIPLLAVYISMTDKVKFTEVQRKMVCSSIFVICGILGIFKAHGIGAFTGCMLAGFVMSWLGDFFLDFPKQTQLTEITGILFFLLGHVGFIGAFISEQKVLNPAIKPVTVWEVLFFVCILITAFAVSRLTMMKFKGMGAAVAVYAVVISVMLVKAVSLFGTALASGNRSLAFLVLSGAALFFFSDAVLAYDWFASRKKTEKSRMVLRIVNLVPYFAAQMLLAGSTMYGF